MIPYEPADWFAKLGPNGEVIPCGHAEWNEWFHQSYKDRSHWIAEDNIAGFRVSTVFLGINHGIRRPLWFETMVFRLDTEGDFSGHDEYGQWRYTTIEEARKGHAEVCEKVRTGEIGE